MTSVACVVAAIRVVAGTGCATPGCSFTTQNNTSTNTCPLVINYLDADTADGWSPADSLFVTTGLYMYKCPSTLKRFANFSNVGSYF